MFSSLPSIALAALTLSANVAAHTVITYPGWRGNNLQTTGLEADGSVPAGSLGQNWNNETNSYEFPYGMQWMYPCEYYPSSVHIFFPLARHMNPSSPEEDEVDANDICEPGGGLPMSQNRTKWPVSGGALAFQPGWFNGHRTAFIYVNIGLGNEPLNYSHPMTPVFQLTGPSNLMYPGTYCLPQVPLPANISYNVGDNATIQLIETAVHGAALYSVSSFCLLLPLSYCVVCAGDYECEANDGDR